MKYVSWRKTPYNFTHTYHLKKKKRVSNETCLEKDMHSPTLVRAPKSQLSVEQPEDTGIH